MEYWWFSYIVGFASMLEQRWAYWFRGHGQMKIWLVAFHDVEQGELADTQDVFALLYDLQRAK